MANRTTAKSNVDEKIVPKVTNAIHRDMVKTDIMDNVVFKEEVVRIVTSSQTNINIDFQDVDRVNVTRTGGGLNLLLSNIVDGQTAWLYVTKSSGTNVIFQNATDITPIAQRLADETTIVYMIVRKGTVYTALALKETVVQGTDTIEGLFASATTAEHNALSVTDKVCVPGRLPTSTTSQKGLVELADSSETVDLSITNKAVVPGYLPIANEEQQGLIATANSSTAQGFSSSNVALTPSNMADIRASASQTQGGTETKRFVSPSTLKNNEGWTTLSVFSDFSGTLRYFKDNIGNIHVRGNLQKSSSLPTIGASIATLPSGYRPSSTVYSSARVVEAGTAPDIRDLTIIFSSLGTMSIIPQPDTYIVGYSIRFYTIFT